MKTLSRLTLVLLGLAAPLALRAAEVAKASARTDVVFEQPEKFTDVKDSDFGTDKGRDAILERLRESIVERADKALPAGQKLVITFTDIDLAGEYEPWRGPQFSDVRIVKSIYPPRLKFSYKITDAAGQAVKEGNEDLRDLAFEMRLTADRQDTLRYEKDILRDWIGTVTRAPKA
jgi:hypothetical protein